MSYETIIYNHTEKSPFKVTEADIIIEELEKIKEKISKLTIYYTTVRGHINLISDNAVYRIIDKEISELKGENK